MSDTLRNQLLGLGFQPKKPERDESRNRRPERTGAPGGGKGTPKSGAGGAPSNAKRREGGARPGQARRGDPGRPAAGAGRGPGKPRPPRSQEDIDLAKAYAIRAQREKDERIAAEAAKQEEARKRREARAQVAELIKANALNDPDADLARHFPYGGKIKRVYVNAEQLKSLNAGELGVIQNDGRYVLVSAEVLAQAEAIFPQAVALKVDPNAPAGEDPYADPKYQVPDDLVW